jgi:hypothetical protein
MRLHNTKNTMDIVDAISVTVSVESICPYCGFRNTELIGTLPDEFDMTCEECNSFYTVNT